MDGFKYSSHRKRHQRAVNKVFRSLNENIEKDSLWQGRFKIVQESSHFHNYDPSGWKLVVAYHFVDTQTGYESHRFIDFSNQLCMWGGTKIFWQMNDFIIKDCRA
jgi:hypothetical protein